MTDDRRKYTGAATTQYHPPNKKRKQKAKTPALLNTHLQNRHDRQDV
jgi:hypothetical protein